MSRPRALLRSHGLDALVAVAAAEAALEVVLRADAASAPRTPLWVAAPAAALVVLPLLGRRRWPFAAPAAVWLLGAGLSFVDGRLVVFTAGVFAAGMAAAFVFGQLPDAVQRRLGLVIVLAGAAIVVYNDPSHSLGDFLFQPALFGIAWLAGLAVRERVGQAEAAEQRAVAAEREREAAAQIAVAEERARIARELHDIVAHAVSVIVLQVGALRHKLPDAQEDDKEALRGVEETGRTALAEMRRLLGAMRQDDDDLELGPQPGLGRLRSLLEGFGRAGLPVRLHVEGEPFALPRAVDLSSYRIVQEGLTNTLKHAGASHADVVVSYAPGEVRIEVHDDGGGAARSDHPGHGLVGIRERVKIYGGEMTAVAVNGDGFSLRTRLPLGGQDR